MLFSDISTSSLRALLLATWSAVIVAQSLQVPAYPIAVKTPYLNSWLEVNNAEVSLVNTWPKFWSNQAITGWFCAVMVDGTPYQLLGDPGFPLVSLATQKSVKITPTRTSFLLQAGPVDVNVTFLSPITVRRRLHLVSVFGGNMIV